MTFEGTLRPRKKPEAMKSGKMSHMSGSDALKRAGATKNVLLSALKKGISAVGHSSYPSQAFTLGLSTEHCLA